MKAREFISESWPFKNRSKIYELLVNATDCGPFDGGCVIFADALRIYFGEGEIVVMIDDNDRAEHAALQIGNKLIDADGIAPISTALRRFRRNERVNVQDIRPFRDGDLPNAPRDIKLSAKIAGLL